MGVEKPKATGRYIYTKGERERERERMVPLVISYRASRKELVKRRLSACLAPVFFSFFSDFFV